MITTEGELDQETCREGVDTAEAERKNNKKCLCDDVSVVVYLPWLWDENKITATTAQLNDNSSAFHIK